jgi:hypothetical protein
VAVAVGCNSGSEFRELTEKDAKQTAPVTGHDHDHEHGPHDGHILELKDHHGEIVLETSRKLTLYILDGSLKNAVPLEDATAEAKLKIGGEDVTVALAALPLETDGEGKASRFQSAEPLPESIKDLEDVEGEVTLTVGGSPVTAPIGHDHAHGDDHGHDH